MKKFLTREVRKYIYALAIAAVPVLVYLGWMDAEAIPLVLPFILALLNLSDDKEKANATESNPTDH